jgi:hypothetical protein
MCSPSPHAVSALCSAYQSATVFWVPHLGTHADQAGAKYRLAAHALGPSGSRNTSSDPRCTLATLFTRRAPVLNSYPSILTISRPFNSLFRVLFPFPSQYLFAIGLGSIFSLGRNLPPIFTQDSQPELLEDCVRSRATVAQCPYGAITVPWRRIPERTWNTRQSRYTRRPQTTTRPPLGSRFSAWALAASLAVTGAIAVAFFSCP